MSTTLVTSRTRQSASTSTSSRRSTATSSTRLPPTTISTSATPSSPTSTSQSHSASEFVLDRLETNSPSPSTTEILNDTTSVYTIAPTIAACSTNDDCANNSVCSNAKCTTMDNAAPFGGSGSNPTSRLTTGSAIGIGIGLVAGMMLLIGMAFCIWRFRGKRPRRPSIEAPMHSLSRTTSNATDQKTLVASMPNSPQYAAFNSRNSMNPGLFARIVAPQEIKEVGNNRQGSMDKKALPLLPLPQLPLPPIPKETKIYALNVSINKSMIMDEDMMQAVSPMRGNVTPRGGGTPRDRAPRYKFEEYVPLAANAPPPISISRPPAPERKGSEYELNQYPRKRQPSDAVALSGGGSNGGSEPPSPAVETFPDSDSKARRLSLPELPPPSPSFSFRSYDWYQDIIEDPNGARTPTQDKFPKPLSLAPQDKMKHMDLGLLPEPSSPGASSSASGMHLHPSSAALLSPTSPNFRLSPTVYTPPPRQSQQSQQSVQKQRMQPKNPSRASGLSIASHGARESRSWVPVEGLYLADEGGLTRYLTFRRGNEDSRPTSYSPLT